MLKNTWLPLELKLTCFEISSNGSKGLFPSSMLGLRRPWSNKWAWSIMRACASQLPDPQCRTESESQSIATCLYHGASTVTLFPSVLTWMMTNGRYSFIKEIEPMATMVARSWRQGRRLQIMCHQDAGFPGLSGVLIDA